MANRKALEMTGVIIPGVEYARGGLGSRGQATTLMMDYDQGGFDDEDDEEDDDERGPEDNAPPRDYDMMDYDPDNPDETTALRGLWMPRRPPVSDRGGMLRVRKVWESYRDGEATDAPPAPSKRTTGKQTGGNPRTGRRNGDAGKDARMTGRAAQRRTWADVEASPQGRLDSFTGDFWFLSNFSMRPFVMDGKTYASGEHAYNALKMTNPADHEMVRSVALPYTAKQVARTLPIWPDWDWNRLDAMSRVLQAKFRDPEMKAMLLRTGDWTLVEGTDDWGDTFWGQAWGVGANHLGKELMTLRDIWRRDWAWGTSGVGV